MRRNHKRQPASNVYYVQPYWVDSAGRTRTWMLYEPTGAGYIECSTKRDADRACTDYNNVLLYLKQQQSKP